MGHVHRCIPSCSLCLPAGSAHPALAPLAQLHVGCVEGLGRAPVQGCSCPLTMMVLHFSKTAQGPLSSPRGSACHLGPRSRGWRAAGRDRMLSVASRVKDTISTTKGLNWTREVFMSKTSISLWFLFLLAVICKGRVFSAGVFCPF